MAGDFDDVVGVDAGKRHEGGAGWAVFAPSWAA